MPRLCAAVKVSSAVVAVAAVLLLSCARERTPPSPVATEEIRLFTTDKLSPSANRVAGIALSEFGGEISLNRHRVSIPSEAVKERVVISIEEPDPRYVVADYGPEGLKFEKPVEVSMSYAGLDLGDLDEKDLTIYYFDPETEAWVDMRGRVDTVEEVVMIRTDHFSRYALSDHHRFQHVVK